MARNLYRIDDALLRAGLLALAVAILASAVVLAAAGGGGSAAGAALVRNLPWLLPVAACPGVLLAAGIAMRRRERQIGAIWSLLRRNAEISVPHLLANSDFRRPELARAIRFLNNRGLAHYVWVRETDVIQDARLRDLHLHVSKCDACGAAIELDVPVGAREIPRCPHCQAPVSADAIQERRDEVLDALRADARDASPSRSGVGPGGAEFSPLVFALLLLACWPAALAYAWLKWQGRI